MKLSLKKWDFLKLSVYVWQSKIDIIFGLILNQAMQQIPTFEVLKWTKQLI